MRNRMLSSRFAFVWSRSTRRNRVRISHHDSPLHCGWHDVTGNEAIPIGFCIDDYCPMCPFKRSHCRGRACKQAAITALKNFPFENLNVHCFVADVSEVLLALSQANVCQSLTMRLTNKATSPPLHSILAADTRLARCELPILPHLRHLCFDSSHLFHINLRGRAMLLTVLGHNLISLEFAAHSPAGLFAVLASGCCPSLRHIRADDVKSDEDFIQYTNHELESLQLIRPHFTPMFSLSQQFSSLKRYKLMPSSKLDKIQGCRVFCASLAAETLRQLVIELPCCIIDDVLVSLRTAHYVAPSPKGGEETNTHPSGEIHSRLQDLHIAAGITREGLVTRRGAEALGSKFGSTLVKFSIFSCKSVHRIHLSKDAFEVMLGVLDNDNEMFPQLNSIILSYSLENVVALEGAMPSIVQSRNESSRRVRPIEITFLYCSADNSPDIVQSVTHALKERLSNLDLCGIAVFVQNVYL